MSRRAAIALPIAALEFLAVRAEKEKSAENKRVKVYEEPGPEDSATRKPK